MPNGREAANTSSPYNFLMADRIVCSCVTCPKCGIWVVIRPQNQLRLSEEECSANCPAAESGREFKFEASEAHVFEIPLPPFRAPSLLSVGIAGDRTIAAVFQRLHRSDLIFSISRQKLLRTAATDTPNSWAISFHSYSADRSVRTAAFLSLSCRTILSRSRRASTWRTQTLSAVWFESS